MKISKVRHGLFSEHWSRTIESISGVGKDQNDNPEVEPSKSGVTPPLHTFVGAVGEEEVALGWPDGLDLLNWLEADHGGGAPKMQNQRMRRDDEKEPN